MSAPPCRPTPHVDTGHPPRLPTPHVETPSPPVPRARLANMAATYSMLYEAERNLRRNRVFRDRTNPIDSWDDAEFYRRLRFRRSDVLEIVDDIQEDLVNANRGRNVAATSQVCLALSFYATGAYQNVCAHLVGVTQRTAGRIIDRVTRALLDRAHRWIVFPDQPEADRQKAKFLKLGGFPDVVGCIDGTHIRIQAPLKHEHEYICRKNFHSINVQVKFYIALYFSQFFECLLCSALRKCSI